MPTALPCNSLKTLTINYTSGSIMPSDGYTIQWRVVGTDTWYTESNKKANPIQIAGVPSCYPLEVRIMADCGTGLQTIETFGVSSGLTVSCTMYELLDDALYTYTPCGTSTATTVSNTSIDRPRVCAVTGSITGGTFTTIGACLGDQG